MKPHLPKTKRGIIAGVGTIAVAAAVAVGTTGMLLAPRSAHASPRGLTFQDSLFYKNFGEGSANNREDAYSDNADGLAAEQADNRAYPAAFVSPDQMSASRKAFEQVLARGNAQNGNWRLLGPTTTNTPGTLTYTGTDFSVAGRTTALGVAATCHPGDCRLYLGSAGGGVWRTDDALAATPTWTSVSHGINSNAIGSLWVDPADSKHVLVGTGEQNGSSDSEAGMGLFETNNGGNDWNLVSGSYAVAAGRSISTVAVDPANASHIFIGTALARHGSSSVNGGRYTPPAAAQIGLYESTDGGASFTLVYSKPSDTVNPASPNGSDFFRGGVSKLAFDSTTPGRVYFSIFDYGLYRGTTAGGYEQVFASAGGGTVANSAGSRTEFALAPLANGKLRIYVGDTNGASPANLYRTDDAGVASPTWTKLSSSTNGTPGFASYNYCSGQCSYDMPVASPAGHPDNVWIGGQMQYGEFFGRSNGRAIQRSTDGGVNFTDMTNDQQGHGMHPDQHVIAFDPENPDIAFTGSDGGLVRTSGSFGAEQYYPCSYRGLSGANLTDCNSWLSQVPTQIFSLNAGLGTLQFQSVSVNPKNPNDLLGGTQDNGTLGTTGGTTWSEQINGDGGQSGIDAVNPAIRVHSYYAPQHDVSFKSGDPLSWDWVSDRLLASNEAASFYTPITNDPVVGGTIFDGLQHVWRTKDSGGSQAYLDQYCNEFTGDYNPNLHPCGDFEPLGGPAGAGKAGDLTSSLYGADKGGSYVVAISRATSNSGTMWTGTRRGRLFISNNADAAKASDVSFTRIDTSATPTRFISGIAVDPKDQNHAIVTFSGYDAYATAAGTVTGHVFDVRYDPTTGTASWTDLSSNLGDQPITSVAYDATSGGIYVSTDWGVLTQKNNGEWKSAGTGLPLVAVYGLTFLPGDKGGTLYAATHGRGIYAFDVHN